MANERNPNTPPNPDRLNNPISPDPYTAEMRSRPPFEQELQADPELAEGPASSSRIALFAIGIAVVLGAVFYGLNHSSVQQASTVPAPVSSQNTASSSPPAAPPGMRDVTPRTNAEPGNTTGAAQNPSPPPAAPAKQ
jgi:hypothetical protein